MRGTETRIQTPVAYAVPLLLARWTTLCSISLLPFLLIKKKKLASIHEIWLASHDAHHFLEITRG